MITKDDIFALREVFRGARMYAGDVEEPKLLAHLQLYRADLEKRMNNTIEKLNEKPKKKKNGKSKN